MLLEENESVGSRYVVDVLRSHRQLEWQERMSDEANPVLLPKHSNMQLSIDERWY